MDHVKVLVTVPELAGRTDFLGEISAVSPRVDVEQRTCRDHDEVAAALGDVEVLYAFRSPSDMRNADRLKWVALHYSGVDNDVSSPIFDSGSGITVTNVAGAHAVPMAEYTITAMAMLVRNFMQLVRDKGTRTLERDHSPAAELWGQTLGIVGYGHIGREVGRLGHAHGMPVLALKRDPRERRASGYQWPGVGDPEGVLPERFFGPDDFVELLKESDFVVNCLPLTGPTKHLFDRAAFKAMRPGSYFINIGRGGTVELDALVHVLRDGALAGAAIDDFEGRSLPPDNPLWEMGNVFISPHISGTRRNVQYLERTNELFCENLRRYLAGEPLFNVVTRERGY